MPIPVSFRARIGRFRAAPIAEDSATGPDYSAAILEALEILLALVTLRHAAQLIVGLELRAGVKSALGLNCPHFKHFL